MVLPETMDPGAQEVLSRICDRVSDHGQLPAISLSAGFAICSRDGNTAETLMDVADRALYGMKVQHKRNPSLLKRATV